MRNSPMTTLDIQGRIQTLLDDMESVTELYGEQSFRAAECKNEYKRVYNKELIRLAANGTRENASTKEAYALTAAQTEYNAMNLADACLSATKQKLETIRTQIDALRTFSANTRVLER